MKVKSEVWVKFPAIHVCLQIKYFMWYVIKIKADDTLRQTLDVSQHITLCRYIQYIVWGLDEYILSLRDKTHYQLTSSKYMNFLALIPSTFLF